MPLMGQRARYRSLVRHIANLAETVEVLESRVERIEKERDSYKDLYRALLRGLFGRRSEQISPDQLQLEFTRLAEEGLEAAANDLAEHTTPSADQHDEQPAVATRKQHHGRGALPDNLPRHRRRIELSVTERACTCCAAAMVEIGEDVTEELEYEPASFYIVEYARVKYACRACEQGIARAPMPERPIDKGRAGPGLLAHIAVAKYADHLPLYRLESIFARAGVEISRQTKRDWIAQIADLVAPVVAELKRQLLTDPFLQSDDKVVPYQGDEKGRVSKGYLWAYTRPYAEVVFDFTTNHSREGPIAFLGDYQGYLQTDGHSSYNGLYATDKIVHIGCLAHVRPKIFDARGQAREEADMVLAAIQSLYRIERQAAAAGIVGAELVELRSREARPVISSLGNWFDAIAPRYRPKSPMAKAVGYARGQWESVSRYVDVAEARPDNNSSEQAIKPVVIGRKNWMFAGSAEGGRRAAVIYSLVVSCKRIGVDHYAYMGDVIATVSTHPNKRIGELTPRAWAAERTDSSHTDSFAVG